jgi:hypothetical protein
LPEIALPVSLRLRGILDEATERLALRAALSASHLLGLATGTHLRKLRAQNDPLAELQARLEEAELRARLAGRPPRSSGLASPSSRRGTGPTSLLRSASVSWS